MPETRRLCLLFALIASSTIGGTRSEAAVTAAGFRAIVMSIGDGDTLRVSPVGMATGRSVTIRLACIDAPETAQSPYGQQSQAYLQQRLPRGRKVSILPHTTDRYGRTVAEVISDININLVMVEDGQAFAYRRYLGDCDAKEYLDAEFRPAGTITGCGKSKAASPAPGTFAVGAPPP
jgi:endonuclease YncB( thermonuclease family)